MSINNIKHYPSVPEREEREFATQSDITNILFSLDYTEQEISTRDFELLDTLIDKVQILSMNNMHPTEMTIRGLCRADRFREYYGEDINFLMLDIANSINLRLSNTITTHIFSRLMMGCKFGLMEIHRQQEEFNTANHANE